jgi:hypothetical protein
MGYFEDRSNERGRLLVSEKGDYCVDGCKRANKMPTSKHGGNGYSITSAFRKKK